MSTARHRCFYVIYDAPVQYVAKTFQSRNATQSATLGLCNLPSVLETASRFATSVKFSINNTPSTPSHLLRSLKDAEAGGYSLGVKLVRGAYHPFEVEASESPEACPVWVEKKDTDACYNQCVSLLLSALRADITRKIPQIGLLFGTHNSESCTKILNGLVHEGIATERDGVVIISEEAADRCAVGQLFGL